MFTQRLITSVAAATLLVGGLTGCSLLEASPEVPLTGLAACALGKTWNLDTAKLAEAVQLELTGRGAGVVVTADGSQTLAWDLESRMTLDTDYTLTLTSGDAAALTVVTDKHVGTATGIAYINSDVAIPREWDASGLEVTTTSTLNDVAQETLPYTIVKTDLDDSVGIEITCDGGALTTHQRGSEITLTWAAQ